MIDQVLDDVGRFRNDHRLSGGGGFDFDDGRLAERVDVLEFLGGEHFFGAFERFEGVVEFELFEEPEDALGAGLFEPGVGCLVYMLCDVV